MTRAHELGLDRLALGLAKVLRDDEAGGSCPGDDLACLEEIAGRALEPLHDLDRTLEDFRHCLLVDGGDDLWESALDGHIEALLDEG